MLPTNPSPIDKETNFRHYAILTGCVTSSIAIILALYALFSMEAMCQAITAFGVFGTLCGITGSIMPLCTDLKSMIKGTKVINIILLVLATGCWFITSVVWVMQVNILCGIVGLIVAISYLAATAFKLKSDVNENIEPIVDI